VSTNDPVDEAHSGLKGFVSIGWLMQNGCSIIDDDPGVYLILRSPEGPPEFLETGSGGWFKGIDPNVPLSVLEEKWMDGTEIMYIGKSGTSLRKRIRTYIRFGEGAPAPHKGGRHIWQLADSRELLVCWMLLADTVDPEELEKFMIREFVEKFGKFPFANRRY
jgi:hypothetical protein